MGVKDDIETLSSEHRDEIKKSQASLAVVVMNDLIDGRIAFYNFGCVALDQEGNARGGRIFLERASHR